MTDAGIGTGTFAPRISAGIASGTNAVGTADDPPTRVASLAADGMRCASLAALLAGTFTLLPSCGDETSDGLAAASPVRAPTRPRMTTAVRSFPVRGVGMSLRISSLLPGQQALP